MTMTQATHTSPSREHEYSGSTSGWVMAILILAMIVIAALLIVMRLPIIAVPLAVFAIFCLLGFLVLQPNESAVLTLFGRYMGTVRSAGFYWVNPFMAKKRISLRVRNFMTPILKVNDKVGNPIDVAAVAVWLVHDTAQAAFDVDNFESYIKIQVEVSLRDVVSTHPYDATLDDAVSLRGNTPAIAELLKEELQRAMDVAGLAVKELRITHLAYAPEVASIMLRRQQAVALIQAREKMVDGAIGMIKMTLHRFNEEGISDFNAQQKASLVTNMMTVLLSESGAQPVFQAGGQA